MAQRNNKGKPPEKIRGIFLAYADAPSIEKGMKQIRDAMLAAFQLYLKQGEEIPEPIDENQFKGNIAYRTTSKRHYLLSKEAQRRHTSLSQLIDEFVDHALFEKTHRR